MTALVIGNGASRKSLRIPKNENIEVFGCNAAYRDMNLDWVVFVDEEMGKEIRSSGFPLEKVHRGSPLEPNWDFSAYDFRENSGLAAMKFAIERGHKEILCVGMDFLLDRSPHTVSNVYQGTENYTEETSCSLGDSRRRARYFDWFARSFIDRNGIARATFKFFFPDNLLLGGSASTPHNVSLHGRRALTKILEGVTTNP